MTELPRDGVEQSLTKAQLEDFALLLERYVNVDNIGAIGTVILGRDARKEAGNDVDNPRIVAEKTVELLEAEGRIADAVTLLLRGSDPNSRLFLGLNYILTGGRLNDDAAMQKFIHAYEPFLSAGGFQETFLRLTRTVCAIGLAGDGLNKIVGSGFLVGPDLVMTNFHVLYPYVQAAGDQVVPGPGIEGEQIRCFFDYLWEPAPRIPPSAAVRHTALEVPAAKDWFVHGRPRLPFDGTKQCPIKAEDKHDFVVFRIAQPIGLLAARSSDGEPRGWLSLPDQVAVFGNSRPRVIVHQHPEAKPQQFDIGEYVQLDPTGTRVWYTVSTAKGSSGGAAVDSHGKLFALHNAEVEDSDPAMNQGVLIDLIAKDLAANVQWWPPEKPPEEPRLSFWSLSEKASDPQPIIGRKPFRDEASAMNEPNGARIMVVSGPANSGRHYSYDLLRRTVGTQRPVVLFKPDELQALEPKPFVSTLVNRLNVFGLAGKPIPDPKQEEDIPRWLSGDLSNWLIKRLAEDEQRDRSRYPAWVVIDTIVPNGYLSWADNLLDAIMTFVGVRAPELPIIDIPQLRWLFLTPENVGLPLGDVKRHHDDLSIASNYRDEFVECLRLAWRSVNKANRLQDTELWGRLAGREMARAPNDPPRRVLSEAVRSIILTRDEDDR